jgi:surface protein
MIAATDSDGDDLTFSITTNDGDLFEITDAGELSLADGKSLDYETATSHAITVEVTDGMASASATVTIDVTDVADETALIFNVTVSAGTSVGLPFGGKRFAVGGYDVDWGDGASGEVTGGADLNHTYASAGTYTVKLGSSNNVVTFRNVNTMVDVLQWGNYKLSNDGYQFSGCAGLVSFSATDQPDLSNLTSTEAMFLNCTSFNGDISGWDVSSITNMDRMFATCTAFNQDISGWDVSNVTDMTNMFINAEAFDQDLNSWQVGNE